MDADIINDVRKLMTKNVTPDVYKSIYIAEKKLQQKLSDMRKCKVCEKQFIRNKRKEYCSDACKQRAYRIKMKEEKK